MRAAIILAFLAAAATSATATALPETLQLPGVSRISDACVDSVVACIQDNDFYYDYDSSALEECQFQSDVVGCFISVDACVPDLQEIDESVQSSFGVDAAEFASPGWCDDNLDIYIAYRYGSASPYASPSPTYYDYHYHDDDDDEHDHDHDDDYYTTDPIGDPVDGLVDAASACFPADAQVEMLDGRQQSMADLTAGEVMRVAPGDAPESFAEVFFFSHKDLSRMTTFVHLCIESGNSLTLSPGHFLVDAQTRELVAARHVRVGDQLQLADGSVRRVTAFNTVRKQGLYAPHTLSASKTLVVDGVLVSEYTEAVQPSIAGPLLRMTGWLYRLGGRSLPARVASALHSNGHWLAESLHLGVDGPSKASN